MLTYFKSGKWEGEKEDGRRKKKKWRIPDLNW